jgi:hypothetical protein
VHFIIFDYLGEMEFMAESLRRKESYEELMRYCKKLESHVMRLEDDLEKERQLRLQSELKAQELKKMREGGLLLEDSEDSEMLMGFAQKIVELSNQMGQIGSSILNEKQRLKSSRSSLSKLSRSVEESPFLRKSSPDLYEDSILINPGSGFPQRNPSPNYPLSNNESRPLQFPKISLDPPTSLLRYGLLDASRSFPEDLGSISQKRFSQKQPIPIVKDSVIKKKDSSSSPSPVRSNFLLCDVSRDVSLAGMIEFIKEKFSLEESEFTLEFGEGGPGAGRVAQISVDEKHSEKFASVKRFRAVVDGVKMRMKVVHLSNLDSLEQNRSRISEDDDEI